MIKIVAIETVIAERYYASKTIVNIFQLVYAVTILLIVWGSHKTPQHLFNVCAVVLLLVFFLRLVFTRFPKVCGLCHTPLDKSNRTACSECGSYNVYDLKRWVKLEFADVEAAHKAEYSRIMQNVTALIFVLLIFSSPVFYLVLVIDKDIRQLNQQRQFIFQQTNPLFLRYKAEHGIFPEYLDLLVPDYIDEIPEVLRNAKKNRGNVLKIDYQVEENQAKFIFNVTHIPNLSASYDIETGRYGYNSLLAQLLL